MKKLIVAIAVCAFSGCSTVTLTPKGQIKFDTNPTYEERLPFFLGGVVGEIDVDAKKICGSRNIKQVQTQNTFVDSLLSIVTISIYSPRTVKIWCDEGKS